MNDSTITFSGWVGSEVTLAEAAGGVAVATFRVGCTPRRFRGGRWEDGETIWYAVKAWRALATHVAESVGTGDPVVVSGRLVAEVWKREDGTVSTRYVVVANVVGHDLNRGTSTFRRAGRGAAGGRVQDQSPDQTQDQPQDQPREALQDEERGRGQDPVPAGTEEPAA